MSSTFGKAIKVTLFGESHGECVGACVEGLAPGLKVDMDYMKAELSKRSARGSISTQRREADEPQIVSGAINGFTEGTPLTVLIKNNSADRGAYAVMDHIARPSHADFTAQAKYLGFQDAAGGGHFSGRLTAPLVAACSVIRYALEEKGIFIGTHISRLHDISDRALAEDPAADIKALNAEYFPVLDHDAAQRMKSAIEKAGAAGDSLGGVLETAVTGLDAGIGEPWFDSVESELAHALFSIPAVKGVEFGAGFAITELFGSQANDPFAIKDGRIVTLTNNSGGINGGITNGMPVVFRTAVKPTASIAAKQKTVDFIKGDDAEIEIAGRHDPAIVHRARAAVDSLTALVIADLYARRCGYMWLRG